LIIEYRLFADTARRLAFGGYRRIDHAFRASAVSGLFRRSRQ